MSSLNHSISISIPIKKLSNAADLPLPQHATEDSAGLDLLAAIPGDKVVIAPGGRALVPTGISLAIPSGYEGQVRSRSGLALKNGVVVLNSPGTIDADYRGEIKIILINFGAESFEITHGMRIAQLILGRYARVAWEEVAELNDSSRQSGGFGSTGLL